MQNKQHKDIVKTKYKRKLYTALKSKSNSQPGSEYIYDLYSTFLLSF